MKDPKASIKDRWRRLGRDFVRYGLCGIGAVAADYATFGALTRAAGWGPVAAQMLSRPAGGVVSFLGNRFWTFRDRKGAGLHVQFARYAVVWAAAYGLSVAAVWAYARLIPDWPFVAKALADGTVVLFSFLANRHWTFRAASEEADGGGAR